MRLLLDTHVLIWSVLAPDRLSPAARVHLEAQESELFVSAGSAWEIATKVRGGRLEVARPLLARYADQLNEIRATSLAITGEQALLAGSLEWEHRDPFDRMIAAQAISEQLVLVTADRAFRGVPALATLW